MDKNKPEKLNEQEDEGMDQIAHAFIAIARELRKKGVDIDEDEFLND